MGLALFDLDRTLIARNSATAWIRRELRLGHLRTLDALRGFAWIARYQLGLADIEVAVRLAIEALAGTDAAAIRARSDDFFMEDVRHWTRRGALSAIAEHKARGDKLAILTSSSGYLAERVAESLGFDAYLANCLEVGPDGLHTGRTIGPICFGAGKLEHARSYAETIGATLEGAAFYTDSVSDLPVLEAVGTPVAVHPDPKLKRIARERGWRVEAWGEPLDTPRELG